MRRLYIKMNKHTVDDYLNYMQRENGSPPVPSYCLSSSQKAEIVFLAVNDMIPFTLYLSRPLDRLGEWDEYFLIEPMSGNERAMFLFDFIKGHSVFSLDGLDEPLSAFFLNVVGDESKRTVGFSDLPGNSQNMLLGADLPARWVSEPATWEKRIMEKYF